MGSCGVAEISVDSTSGQVTIYSRHKVDVKQRKILGAVAILLVEPDPTSAGSDADPMSALSVPSSVSVITSPCVGGAAVASPTTSPRMACQQGRDSSTWSRQSDHSNVYTTLPTSLSVNTQNESHTRMNSCSSSVASKRGQFEGMDYQCQSPSTRPPNNVSVIDLTDGPVSRYENQPNEKTPTAETASTRQLPAPVPPTSTYTRPAKDSGISINRKSLTPVPRVSTPFSSRVALNLQLLQRKRHRNVKITTVVQDPAQQNSNDAKCLVCGDVVSTFAENQSHSERHSLPYKCVVCGIALRVTNNLRRHFLGHVRNVAYTCPFCPAMYRRKDNLTTHLFQKHNINSWQRRLKDMVLRSVKETTETSTNNKNDQNVAPQLQFEGPPTANIVPVALSATTVVNPTAEVVMDTYSPSENNLTPIDVDVTPEPPHPLSNDMSVSVSSPQQTCHVSQTIESPIEIKDEVEDGDGCQLHITSVAQMDQRDEQQTNQTDQVSTSMHSANVDGLSMLSDSSRRAFLDIVESSASTSSSIINYSCSTCDVKFPELERLQRHVIDFHSDQVSHGADNSNDANAPVSSEILANSGSGPYMRLFNEARHSDGDKGMSNIRGRSDQLASLPDDVIDIENLGDISNFPQSDSVPGQQSVYPDAGSGDMMTSVNDFLGNSAYPTFLQHSPLPNQESSTNSSQNFDTDIGVLNGASAGRKKITVGNNKCLVCGVLLTTWEAIMDHGDQHKLDLSSTYQSSDPSCKKFPCVVCYTVLSTKDSLRRHAVNHMGVQHFCNRCMAVYNRRDNLLKHMRESHGIHMPRT